MTNSSSQEEEKVSLVIRCAFQTSEDQPISVPVAWNVKQLKEHIHENHPARPAVSSQRLIFCGGCLSDDNLLQDIFDETRRVVDGPQVIHLVCPLPQSTPELRRRGENQHATNFPTSSMPPSYESLMAGWTDYYNRAQTNDPSALEAYNNYYSSYINYYHHYQSSVNISRSAAFSYPHAVYVHNGPGVPMVPYMAGPAHNNINNVPVVNNQGNNGRNVARRFEDGIELFYKFIRVALLMTVVLLYSSVERFFLVVGIVVVIMLTQLRRAQNRRAAQAAHLVVNNNNAGEQVAAGGNENTGEDVPIVENNHAEAPVVEQQSGLQVFLATCYSFVTSFVASLVPENIAVDAN